MFLWYVFIFLISRLLSLFHVSQCKDTKNKNVFQVFSIKKRFKNENVKMVNPIFHLLLYKWIERRNNRILNEVTDEVFNEVFDEVFEQHPPCPQPFVHRHLSRFV